MPQALLPLVPHGATPINDSLSVVRQQGQWTYFLGVRPVFGHDEEDQLSFRMFTAQLICQGTCRQAEIVRTFGVSANSVKRSVKKFREQGTEAFYQPRRGRGATVLTPEVVREAQERLYRGESRGQVAKQLGIKPGTLRKAINQGRLSEPRLGDRPEARTDDPDSAGPPPSKQAARRGEDQALVPGEPGVQTPGGDQAPRPRSELSPAATAKSQRTVQDAAAADGLGMACTRVLDRVAAALGLLPGGAATRFEPCLDVPFGGVMCALPSLAQNGLFRHLDACFTSLGGYYTTLQVMTLLGYMALCRIKTVEQLQYQPPGELGKLLGLDRVPEVRCLRYKLTSLAAEDAAQQWGALLSRDWLEASLRGSPEALPPRHDRLLDL
jgi:transposase